MLSKITLRLKITIITALALSFVAISVTALSIYNAGQTFIIPYNDFTIDGYIQTFLLPADALPEAFRPLNLDMLNEHQRKCGKRQNTICL